jgi:phospholipid/cholesterol/gamma-HCH transport system substrate-binding protein
MSESTTEVIVGGVVLAAALGFVLYAGQLTGLSGPSGAGQEYSASFRSAQGVSVGTDVRMAGVKVGTVTDLELNPETFRADARFTVAEGIALPEDTAAVISSEGLLGGNFLELLPGGSPFNLEPGSEIEDTQSAVSIVELLLKFASGNGAQ